MNRRCFRLLAVVALAGFLATPLYAQNVLTVRVDSVDALIEDLDTLAVALGQEPGASEGLFAMAQGALGLPDLAWLDRKNPLVVALPLQGMMLGDQGFVGAFPAADVEAALGAIAEAAEGAARDENGMLRIPLGEEQAMYMMAGKGYVVFGKNPSLVGGFAPGDLLSGAHLPPGTLAAEFNVDSMRAMIGMGLQSARAQLGAALAQGAEESGDALPPEAAQQMSEAMIGWMESLVANTRSVQLAVEVTGEHVLVHNHYLPVQGSTLAGFLREQKGGMPDVARMLDADGASMVFVANMTWTDAAVEAVQSFMDGYVSMLQSSLGANDEAAAALGDWMPAMMEQYAAMFDCMRGDIAQVVDFRDGMRFSQVSGLKDGEACEGMADVMTSVMTSLPEGLDELFEVEAEAVQHRGVRVSRFGMNMTELLSQQDEEVSEEVADQVDTMMQSMFGEDGFQSLTAVTDGLMLGTGGVDAEDAIKTLIDRAKDRKRGSGIDASAFAPFDVNAGLYMMMDMGGLLAGIASVVPESESGELAEAQEIFDALGAMTGAVEFQADAVAVKLAMPTSGLAAIAELAASEAAEELEVREHEEEPAEEE